MAGYTIGREAIYQEGDDLIEHIANSAFRYTPTAKSKCTAAGACACHGQRAKNLLDEVPDTLTGRVTKARFSE
jgi:hypothetical protein